MSGPPPPDWYADPAGRHEMRRWDGATWTADVRDGSQLGSDPLIADSGPGWEYDVTELREKMFGRTPSEKLQQALNEKGAEGWRFKAMVSGDVLGVFGGKKEGWMLVMERERS